MPAQQRLGKRWFSGSADAILQSLNLINDEKPDIVVVIGADHVYRMDFRQMLDAHIESGARATVAGIRQPISLANQFGVIDVDDEDPAKIREFLEKPQNPTGLADSPDEVLASMGNYIFDTDALIEAVEADGELPTSNHDMGGDIIPYFVGRGEAGVYDMKRNDVPGSTDRDRDYWRDVGTIDSFFDAHQDLISTLPIFNLYNMEWPIHSQTVNSPPAKFVRDSVGRIGNAIDSIVSLGSVLSGTHLERSVVGPWTLAGGGSTITDSVLFDHVRVGAGARIHRAILDKNVVLADGATVGVDRETRHRARLHGHRHRHHRRRQGRPRRRADARVRGERRCRGASVEGMPAPSARFLVVLDADSTLIRNEVIELIADEAGRGAEVAAATEAAMRGEVDFADEPALAGRRRSPACPCRAFAHVLARIEPTPGRARADRRRARARRPGRRRLRRLPRDPRHDRPRARRGRVAREPARGRATAR